jgi:5-(hydroxymethyl)furfural/furfural oxidase
VEGYRRAREAAAELVPGGPFSPDVTLDVADAEALRRMVRGNAYSVPHFAGTCAMGPSPDDGAVVDSAGRIHGADGLYVVDASIMPTVPSGFTHLPTLMLAERLSESIATSLG